MKKLFSANIHENPNARDLCHSELEKILASKEHPEAECREDHSTGEYSVWSAPVLRVAIPVVEVSEASAEKIAAGLSEEQMDRLATLIAKKLKG